VAAAFLVAAAIVGADPREPRSRDAKTLTLVIAAALAASPIVWVHYFLLLLVPLALTRPRLSALWFVPLLYTPLGETAWPAGDATKLALALLATSVLLVAAMRPMRPARQLDAIFKRRLAPWGRLRLTRAR
jgi:hypothetical protein